MGFKLKWAVVAATIFSTFQASADWVGPMHDVKEFEISGVKLGMDATDTVNNLIRFYDTSRESIGFSGRPEAPIVISFKNDRQSFTARFNKFTAGKGQKQYIVQTIRLHQTKQDESMVPAAIEKYGQASHTHSALEKTTYRWCTEKSTENRRKVCDEDSASLSLYDNQTLTLATGEYRKLEMQQERQAIVDFEVPFESFDRNKLYSPIENQRPLPTNKTQSLSGEQNCPEVWKKFLDYYGRAVVAGNAVEDETQTWVAANGLLTWGGFRQFKDPWTNEEFFSIFIKPVLEIEQLLEVAVVCDKVKDHPNPTRFVAAQYLNKAGELGRLMLRDHRSGNYGVVFGVRKDNVNFSHAINYNFFKPLPNDFSSQLNDTVEELSKSYSVLVGN